MYQHIFTLRFFLFKATIQLIKQAIILPTLIIHYLRLQLQFLYPTRFLQQRSLTIILVKLVSNHELSAMEVFLQLLYILLADGHSQNQYIHNLVSLRSAERNQSEHYSRQM